MDVVEWVPPGDLRRPVSRPDVDLMKLAGHLRRFSTSVAGMPAIEVSLPGRLAYH
jgi:hypothetical protein